LPSLVRNSDDTSVNTNKKANYMETSPGSISLEQLIAFFKRHIYVTPRAEERLLRHGETSVPQPQPWRPAAEQIITLVNLKQAASKTKGTEELVRRIDAQIAGVINGSLEFPNPDDPGTSAHSVPIQNSLGWHWPPGPPPGPLFLAGELNRYSQLVGGSKEIDAIAVKLVNIRTAATAGSESLG
jgi:hypothetical protein